MGPSGGSSDPAPPEVFNLFYIISHLKLCLLRPAGEDAVVEPRSEPLPRLDEDPRPLAELAPHLHPDRGDLWSAQNVPLGEVGGVEAEGRRRPDLAEGEARFFERRLQLVDGRIPLLGPHHPVDPV